MIGDLLAFLWAAAEICFAALFLSAFLEPKHSRSETAWTLLGAWLLDGLFGLLDVQGLHGYLMYLLMTVFLLLALYGEYSARGICLLLFALLIPAATDALAAYFAEEMRGLSFYLAMTGSKAFDILFALVLRRYKRTAKQTEDLPDSESLLLQQHMELQRESMHALEQSYRLQRKSTHEFGHHLQVLRDLLEQGETEAACNYLAQLRRDRTIHVVSVRSNHPVVDVILNQKHQSARQNGIKMQIQVNDLSASQTPSDALAVVLTNLLDNAIEACCRIDGYREIFCSVLYDEGLYISIRNTSLPVSITDGKIPTSKQNPLSHGYGLLSVSYMLDQLGAEYTFGYEEGWFHFTAEIE
ncbi:MAG: GHKL domain-containing protein [Firmicutes bacterium]|nr:GHKL domain-containing protein [Bacillota bacterium]